MNRDNISYLDINRIGLRKFNGTHAHSTMERNKEYYTASLRVSKVTVSERGRETEAVITITGMYLRQIGIVLEACRKRPVEIIGWFGDHGEHQFTAVGKLREFDMPKYDRASRFISFDVSEVNTSYNRGHLSVDYYLQCREEAKKPEELDMDTTTIYVGDRYQTNRLGEPIMQDLRILSMFSVVKEHTENHELVNHHWVGAEQHQVMNGARRFFVVYELYESAVLSDACAYGVRVSELYDFLNLFKRWEPILAHRNKEHIPPEAAPRDIKPEDIEPQASEDNNTTDDGRVFSTCFEIHGMRTLLPGATKPQTYASSEYETYPTDEFIKSLMIAERLTSAQVVKRYRMTAPDMEVVVSRAIDNHQARTGTLPKTIGVSRYGMTLLNSSARYAGKPQERGHTITTFDGIPIADYPALDDLEVSTGL